MTNPNPEVLDVMAGLMAAFSEITEEEKREKNRQLIKRRRDAEEMRCKKSDYPGALITK